MPQLLEDAKLIHHSVAQAHSNDTPISSVAAMSYHTTTALLRLPVALSATTRKTIKRRKISEALNFLAFNYLTSPRPLTTPPLCMQFQEKHTLEIQSFLFQLIDKQTSIF